MVDVISRPQAISISVTDLVRARVSSSPVTIPVNGSVYARFQNIAAVPSGSEGSISYMRIRALDSLIGRLRAQQTRIGASRDLSEVERREELLAQASRELAADRDPRPGLFLDALV